MLSRARDYPADVQFIEQGKRTVILVGTAHVSQQSVDLVQKVIDEVSKHPPWSMATSTSTEPFRMVPSCSRLPEPLRDSKFPFASATGTSGLR